VVSDAVDLAPRHLFHSFYTLSEQSQEFWKTANTYLLKPQLISSSLSRNKMAQNMEHVADHDPKASNPRVGDMGKDPMPIAIVGMACRLSGIATSPEGLWKRLSKGVSGWSRRADSRFKMDAFYHPATEISGVVSLISWRPEYYVGCSLSS
jgi:hypothetical protein